MIAFGAVGAQEFQFVAVRWSNRDIKIIDDRFPLSVWRNARLSFASGLRAAAAESAAGVNPLAGRIRSCAANSCAIHGDRECFGIFFKRDEIERQFSRIVSVTCDFGE